MDRGHVSFPVLLDHLAGRADQGVAAHLEACRACAARATEARRLLAAGRRAVAAPRPSRRALRRAMRIFQDAQKTPRTSLLKLVLDSWMRPAPALRRTAAGATRFLRFEGAVTVELQITPAARGVELRGQITPADAVREVTVTAGRLRRRADVAGDGTFVFSNLPRREVELELDGLARIETLEL